MIDVITYTSDLPAFRQWLSDNHSVYPRFIGIDENGAYVMLSKTPTFSNGNHSVSLVRVNDLDFINASPLEILSSVPIGEDPFALLSGASLEKYNLAYPRPIITIPSYTIEGETFPESTYQEPEKFGGFA